MRPLVLAHHGVGTVDDADDPSRLVLHPRRFGSQVRMLRRLGYRFRTAGEVIDGDAGRERTAVLTFDDGWRDGVDVVLPLLRSWGIRATFFVCPGWLGGTHPLVSGPAGKLLDEAGVRSLRDAGMEIGSHSWEHRDLGELSPHELAEDLVRSKRALEDLTGDPCRLLAYPFGLFGPREERAAEAAGYELAFAWTPGPWGRFAAPRLPAPPRHGGLRLALKLLGIRRRVEPHRGSADRQ